MLENEELEQALLAPNCSMLCYLRQEFTTEDRSRKVELTFFDFMKHDSTQELPDRRKGNCQT